MKPLAAAAACVVAVVMAGALAPTSALPVDAWTKSGEFRISGLTQAQGLATVTRPDGTTYLFYDGTDSVPPDKAAAGWNHVGDPDSVNGYIFQPYQAADGATAAKLFHAIAPGGAESDFVHADVAGEQINNSFVAISPDGQWMVSGEWDQMTRFLVMPTPILNPSAPPAGSDLPLTGQVLLDTTVTDIQGCAFQTTTRLLCSSDDPVAANGIPRKAMIQVDLAHALDGGDVAGAVTPLFEVPLPNSTCPVVRPGSWPDDMEVEGVDVDRGTGMMRVEAIPPGICGASARVYEYEIVPPPTTTTTSTSTTLAASVGSGGAPGTSSTAVSPALSSGALPATGGVPTWELFLATALVLGGVALVLVERRVSE